MARKEALQELGEVLIKRRDALRKAMAGDLSSLKELRQQSSGDVVDIALDSAQDEINSQLAEVESRELTNIDHALEKIRAGAYGKCERCIANIPLARLQALPYATLCINCKREVEETGEEVSAPDWSRLIDAPADNDLTLPDVEMDIS